MKAHSKKVLAADDHHDTIDIVTTALRREGFEVFSATDGITALETARRIHPDLLLLDFRMPHKDGLEVCSALKRDPATSDTTIILWTAEDDPDVRKRALACGVNDFWMKPIDVEELTERAKRYFV